MGNRTGSPASRTPAGSDRFAASRPDWFVAARQFRVAKLSPVVRGGREAPDRDGRRIRRQYGIGAERDGHLRVVRQRVQQEVAVRGQRVEAGLGIDVWTDGSGEVALHELEHARMHGATDTLIGGTDIVERILEMTGGFGADYTFEATGSVTVMRQAVESARMGWGLCTVAGVAGKGEVLEVVPRFLITGRRVTGSSFGGVKGRTQVPLLVDRWLAGDIDVESLLSHRITLDEVNHGFELMEAQDGIRSVITFD